MTSSLYSLSIYTIWFGDNVKDCGCINTPLNLLSLLTTDLGSVFLTREVLGAGELGLGGCSLTSLLGVSFSVLNILKSFEKRAVLGKHKIFIVYYLIMKFFEKERERKAFFQKSFLSQKLINYPITYVPK